MKSPGNTRFQEMCHLEHERSIQKESGSGKAIEPGNDSHLFFNQSKEPGTAAFP